MINIDDLTLGQIKELRALSMFSNNDGANKNSIDALLIGKKVIVRTYSAGAWFGTLKEKTGSEVILCDARRLWKFKAVDGICLSAVAQNGIEQCNSRISIANPIQWLDSIEIIPCSVKAALSIEGAENAKP